MKHEVSIDDLKLSYLKQVIREVNNYSASNIYKNLFETIPSKFITITSPANFRETFHFNYDPHSLNPRKGWRYNLRMDSCFRLWKSTNSKNSVGFETLSAENLKNALDELMVSEVLGSEDNPVPNW
jgi:hypothetical protein